MKIRINIERISFILTIICVYAIITYFIEGDDSKWENVLGALFLIPSAYFTFSYFVLGDGLKVFLEEIPDASDDKRKFFNVKKYLFEYLYILIVTAGIAVIGLVFAVGKWIYKNS